MEATLIDAIGNAYTALSLLVAHTGDHRLAWEHSGARAAQQLPFTDCPSALYVRRNRADRQRKINVFDGDGNKVYTIERPSRLIPMWSILEYPSRKEIATVHTGLVDRSFDFHNKKGLQHRELQNNSLLGRKRKFYTTDGAPYIWDRRSKYLERIVNPGGYHEEVRDRVARARLMRQFRFDYEILIDESKIDREVVLASAFLTMMTEWGLGHKTRTTGPTLYPKNIKPGGHSVKKTPPGNSTTSTEPQKSSNQSEAESNNREVIVENRLFLVVDSDTFGSKSFEQSSQNPESFARLQESEQNQESEQKTNEQEPLTLLIQDQDSEEHSPKEPSETTLLNEVALEEVDPDPEVTFKTSWTGRRYAVSEDGRSGFLRRHHIHHRLFSSLSDNDKEGFS